MSVWAEASVLTYADAQEGAAAMNAQASMLQDQLTAALQQRQADVAKHDTLEAALATAQQTQQGLQEAKIMLEAKVHEIQVPSRCRLLSVVINMKHKRRLCNTTATACSSHWLCTTWLVLAM